MRYFKIVSIIVIALHFVACHSFPIKSTPGLYVNNSPAFSVSYPANWLEKTPEPQSGFVFRAESPEDFPGLRIGVFPNMSAPLEYSAGFYFRGLAKIGKDIKLIYDKNINLEVGIPAQEAELEWIDNSGIKVNVLILTVKKDNTWIAIALGNNKGRIDEDLKKIAYSLKIKPEEKTLIPKKDISCPIKSVPGLFVNGWPAFSVSYPTNWLERAPEPQSKFVFAAEGPEGFPSFRILVITNISAPLEYSSKLYISKLAEIGKDIKLIYDMKTHLEAGSPAQEAELEWVDNSGIKLNAIIITTKKEDTWIATTIVNNKGRIDKDLRKIAYTLKIKPEEKGKISYKYKAPEQTDDGWQTAHIAEAKLDERKLTDLIGKILNGTYINIHSVLIIKNGKLVLEEYFPGQDLYRGYKNFTRDDLHGLASVTKSFTSTLIGIAIDKGMIKGTDEDLIAFFPEYEKELRIDNKASIKLRDVLSMTAGFDWDEATYSYTDPRNSNSIMLESENIIDYILNRPIKDQPGSIFTYNTGLSTLLGVIVEKRSSLKIKEFAQKYLFGPLGISKYEWEYHDKAGKVPSSGGGLFLRPRDMAKLGYLFVNNGKWKGEQIISNKWIEEATSEHIKLAPTMLTGYGYQWWIEKFMTNNNIIESYVAHGWGGQRIFVFPSLDMVVVFTAGNYFIPHSQVINMTYSMVNNYVLPALLSSE